MLRQVPEKLKGTPKQLQEIVRRFRERTPKAGCMIGLDLGGSSVKAVRIEADERGAKKITGFAVEDLPLEIGEGPAWDQAITHAVTQIKQQGVLNGPVVMGFHHIDSLIEMIRLPEMPAAELHDAIIWEAKEKLSLKPERSIIRHVTIGKCQIEDQPHLDILVIAAPRDALLNQWKILADLGLRVVAVEPLSLGSFYGLSGGGFWKPLELVGLLEVGMKVSHLSFVRGDTIHFSRTFHVAGDSFTRSIADYLQAEYGEAERLKHMYGISKMALEEDRLETGHEADERVRISHALGLHLEQLIAEIEQSFRYFAIELGGTDAQRLDRILVTGGGGQLKYLAEFLKLRLSIPAEVVDPLQNFEMNPEVQSRLQPGMSQRLAVPIGLAMRDLV